MRKKILIIDDEPGFTKIVKLTLEGRDSYEVRELNNPAMAVHVARQFSPDIILLDIIMPKFDGGDVISQLRNDPVLKKIPVLFVTATVLKSEVDAHQGHIGGEFFIAKPVSPEGLIRAIEGLIAP